MLAACKTLGIRRKRAAPLHLRTLRDNGASRDRFLRALKIRQPSQRNCNRCDAATP